MDSACTFMFFNGSTMVYDMPYGVLLWPCHNFAQKDQATIGLGTSV